MPQVTYPKEAKRKTGKKQKDPFAKSSLNCPCCSQERPISKAQTLRSLEKTLRQKGIKIYGDELEGWTIRRIIGGRGLTWACDLCLLSGRAIPANPWLQLISNAAPDFTYFDRTFPCEDCKTDFVFSAKEQQYWFEKLQFGTYSYPKQCPKCRRKRRIFKLDFHNLQRALAKLDSERSPQLAEVAVLYLKIANEQKALEFFRRAKNRAKSPIEIEGLEEQIKKLQSKLTESQAQIEPKSLP